MTCNRESCAYRIPVNDKSGGFSTVSTFSFDILHMFQEYNIHQYSICLYKLLFSTGLWSKPSFACTALRGGLGGGQAGCYRPNWVPRHAVCSLRCSAHGRAASCHLRMEVGSWKVWQVSYLPCVQHYLCLLHVCLPRNQQGVRTFGDHPMCLLGHRIWRALAAI